MFPTIYFYLDKLRSFLVISLLSFVVILCFIQVVLRYFTSDDITPFSWGDEIIRLTSIWVIFLAASCGARKGAHMTVDFFIDKLNVKSKFLVKKITLLIVLITIAAIVYYGFSYTLSMKKSMLQNLPISMAWFYSAIPIGMSFLFLEYFLLFINYDPQKK